MPMPAAMLPCHADVIDADVTRYKMLMPMPLIRALPCYASDDAGARDAALPCR